MLSLRPILLQLRHWLHRLAVSMVTAAVSFMFQVFSLFAISMLPGRADKP